MTDRRTMLAEHAAALDDAVNGRLAKLRELRAGLPGCRDTDEVLGDNGEVIACDPGKPAAKGITPVSPLGMRW